LFVILLPPLFGVFYLIKDKLRAARKNARSSSEKSLQYLQEALSGYVESNIYHKNEVFLDRFVTYQRQFNKYVTDQMIVQGLPGRLIEIFALMGIVILIAVSKYSGNNGGSAIITIGVFMAAAYKIIPGIVKILSLSGQVNSYAFTLDNLGPASPPTTATPPTPGSSQPLTGTSTPIGAQPPADTPANIRSVRFNNVRFSYDGRRILHDQRLQLSSGDFLGIEGLSGRGKTTILNLLLGFLSPDEGDILINDNITDRSIRQQYWRNISYVKQQPFLIHDSIRRNITLNGIACDETKLHNAIKAAGLEGLIASFPEKGDKIIAENGKNISGGQRQRISIARALYKAADLIILDEPFNELDETSEIALLTHFQQLAQNGKMVILITHNKQSLSFCNKIVSLDGSTI
jgi:ABC-type multidrug transport system fused ATPase/permease subunit